MDVVPAVCSGSFICTIFNWQTLLGAFIGSGGAFLLWIVAEWYRNYQRRKDGLETLTRTTASALISVAEAHRTMHSFVDTKLTPLIDQADTYKTSDQWFLGSVFFPLFAAEPMDMSLFGNGTGSGYVDSKVIQVINRSHDFPKIIDDARRQFEFTLQNHRELVFSGKNSPAYQNAYYKEQLENYRIVMKEEVLLLNIPVYAKQLAELQVCLKILSGQPAWWWKFRYGSSFKYFCSYKCAHDFKQTAHSRIEQSLNKDVERRWTEVRKAFVPELADVASRPEI